MGETISRSRTIGLSTITQNAKHVHEILSGKVAWSVLHTAGKDTSVSPYGGQIRRINYRGINKACRSHRDDFGILIADDANQKTL